MAEIESPKMAGWRQFLDKFVQTQKNIAESKKILGRHRKSGQLPKKLARVVKISSEKEIMLDTKSSY